MILLRHHRPLPCGTQHSLEGTRQRPNTTCTGMTTLISEVEHISPDFNCMPFTLVTNAHAAAGVVRSFRSRHARMVLRSTQRIIELMKKLRSRSAGREVKNRYKENAASCKVWPASQTWRGASVVQSNIHMRMAVRLSR